MADKDYIHFISEIKQSIFQSRYKATSLANREMLLLYYHTGNRLSQKIKDADWGAGIIRNISSDLQNELPGLRGFSYRNLMKMRQFAEEYTFFQFVPLPTAQLNSSSNDKLKETKIGQLPATQLKNHEIIPLITTQFNSIEYFIEKIFSGYYVSEIRNLKIAGMFKQLKMIEKYGSGFSRIIKAFKAYNLRTPKFENFQSGFRTTVFAEKINVKSNDTDVVENVVENRLDKILNLIKNNNKISASQISKYNGKNSTTRFRKIEINKQNKANRF